MSCTRMLTTVTLAVAVLTGLSSIDARARPAGAACPAGAHASLHPGDLLHLQIDRGFSPYERAKLLQAVNEWNYALAGALRFDIVEAAPAGGAPVWHVLVNRALSRESAPRGGYELAITLANASGGGLVMINAAEIDGRDIAAVMRHELGHVLGLCHDPTGGLMAARYSPVDQGCIDRDTIDALADELAVPLSDRRGCARR